MEPKRIVIIRMKGDHNLRFQIKSTLKMLRLYKKYNCAIIKNTPEFVGMVKSIKEFITWGEIDKQTFKNLLVNRGKLPGNKRFDDAYIKQKTNLSTDEFVDEFFTFRKELKDLPGLKQYFRLRPPTKGFERKGTKIPYSLGGSLGYRKEKINDLINRMI